MAPTPSILLKTQLNNAPTGAKLFSNRFHFAGGTPADLTAWTALATDIITSFKTCINDSCVVKEAVCYPAGSDVALHTIAENVAGTGNTTREMPSFCCSLVRWSTDQRTSKNHPIYLYSYIHGVCNNGATDAASGQIDATMLGQIQAFATKFWNAGFTDGTNTYHRAGPNGAVATASFVDSWIRDHDLSPR